MNLEHAVYDVTSYLLACGVVILGFMAIQLWNINSKMAVVISKIDDHADDIEDHEKRLRGLELVKNGHSRRIT